MSRRRKVLVIGSGGREHALALRLLESESVEEIIVTPGNAGTSQAPPACAGKRLRNAVGPPVDVATSERPDLAVIGPEAPLCAGLVDDLGARGIRCFGPSRAAAALEGSKAFMKRFAARHGLRTARFEVVSDAAELGDAVRRFPEPPVVKADGLCAGKGVVVASSYEESEREARAMLVEGRFGAAGRTVVLEERILGAELSLHGIADGERVLVLPAAQDHKRLSDGDTGPNTGGMGTYAPAPLADARLVTRMQSEVLERAVRGMAEDGHPFVGTLFAGLMIDRDGNPVLLEFNVRFGDPETQVLVNVVDGDLAETLDAAARGELDPTSLRSSASHAVCIVLAAAGYPDSPRKGDPIDGLERAAAVEGVRLYHAGTSFQNGGSGPVGRRSRIVTAGGRILGVTGTGGSLVEAHERAYRAAAEIRFSGMQLRNDIARQALTPTSDAG